MSSYRTSKVDEAYYDVFTVFDTDGLTPKTGETVFAVSFTKDGGVETPVFVVAEIGTSGTYLLTVAAGFDAVGMWVVTVVPAFNSSTWRSEVEVRVHDIDEVFDAVIAGGSGTESVVITTRDDISLVPIPDVLISVYDATGAVFITFGRTDNSGELPLSLNPDDYTLRFFKPGVACPETVITVIDTGGMTQQDFIIDCPAVIVDPPPSPELCRLYGDFTTLSGLPIQNFKILVKNLYDPETETALAAVEAAVEYSTDAAGHVEFDVVRGTRVRLALITTSLSRDVVVPDVPVQNLTTLLGVTTDAFQIVKG